MFSKGLFLGPVLVLTSAICTASPATSSRTLRFHRAEVTALSWSNDGQTLASGDADGLVVLSDAQTGKVRSRWQYKDEDGVVALAFSPNNQQIAVGRGREIRLLNATTGAPIRVFRLQKPVSGNIYFSADGTRLMCLESDTDHPSANFFVDVWQLPSGKQLRHWSHGADDSFASAMAPDGKVVAIATMGKIELRNIATGQSLNKWDSKDEEWPYVLDLSWSENGKWLAVTGGYYEGPGHFDVWSSQTHKRVWGQTFGDWSTCIAFSPHNRLLAVGTEYDTEYVDKPRAPGGDVMLYDLATHKPKYTLKGHKAVVNILAWSPDGKRIASGSDDKTVRIWTLTR